MVAWRHWRRRTDDRVGGPWVARSARDLDPKRHHQVGFITKRLHQATFTSRPEHSPAATVSSLALCGKCVFTIWRMKRWNQRPGSFVGGWLRSGQRWPWWPHFSLARPPTPRNSSRRRSRRLWPRPRPPPRPPPRPLLPLPLPLLRPPLPLLRLPPLRRLRLPLRKHLRLPLRKRLPRLLATLVAAVLVTWPPRLRLVGMRLPVVTWPPRLRLVGMRLLVVT